MYGNSMGILLNLLCASYLSVDNVSTEGGQRTLSLLEGQVSSVQELAFAFKRAASRLEEMSSQSYLDKHAAKHTPRWIMLCLITRPNVSMMLLYKRSFAVRKVIEPNHRTDHTVGLLAV